MLAQAEYLNKAIFDLDQRTNDILLPTNDDDFYSFPGGNLLTIPGVGPKTIAAILSAIGSDGQSFASGKQLIGIIGFFPKIYDFGETRRDNKLSKRGPKYLRSTLYIAAVACIKHNKDFKSLYSKKISQGKSGKQSLIYVAKKLSHLCLSMLKSGESYNPASVFMPV